VIAHYRQEAMMTARFACAPGVLKSALFGVLMTIATVAAPPPAMAQTARPQVSRVDITSATKSFVAGRTAPRAASPARADASRPAVSAPRPRWQRGLWAALGAFGGFWEGGALGAHLDGTSCGCDDPGLRGFLVGAPIGAITGGSIAWTLTGLF
jgi:hypothetical protein